MLSEDKIRELLLKAGATVPIGAGGPVEPEEPQRRWISLAAVSAVAATVAAIFVATDGSDGGNDPAPAPPTWPTEIPNAYELGPNQVPLLFGFTVEDATAVLENQGFAVAHRLEESCGVPDRVTATSPEVGTAVEAGAVVTIVTAKRETPGVCGLAPERRADEEMAWSLLDFAAGRGGPPEFADEVDYYLGDFEHLTLMREDAEDPASWDRCPPGLPTRCPLSPWRELAHQQYSILNGQPQMPHLEFDRGPAQLSACSETFPLAGGDNAIRIALTVPMDGISLCRERVQVITNSDGDIDTVVLSSRFEKSEFPYDVDVQPVVGESEEAARDALEGQGLQVEVIRPPGTKQCIAGDGPVVASQDPAALETVVASSTVTLTMRWVLCGEVRANELAAQFISFAQDGDDPPVWSDEVELYLGNQLVKTISAADADQRASWRLCTAYGGISCPFSALETLQQFDHRPVLTTFVPDGCPLEELTLPPEPEALGFLALGPAEPEICLNEFVVQLWYDANAITAVNLLLVVP